MSSRVLYVPRPFSLSILDESLIDPMTALMKEHAVEKGANPDSMSEITFYRTHPDPLLEQDFRQRNLGLAVAKFTE